MVATTYQLTIANC